MSGQLSFIEYQNAPRQEKQTSEAQQIFDRAIKKGYSRVPNIYYKKIKTALSPSQSHICDVVIRHTYGYNRPECHLTTEDFMKGKYEKRIIYNAKRWLKDRDILISRGRRGNQFYYINMEVESYKLKDDYVPEPKSSNDAIIELNFDTDPHIEIGLDTDPHIEIGLDTDPHIEIELDTDPHIEIELDTDPHIEIELDIDPHIDIPEISQIENSDDNLCGNVDNSTIQEASDVQNFCTPIIMVPGDLGLNDLKKQTGKTSENFKEKKAFVCFSISDATGMGHKGINDLIARYGIEKCLDKLEILEDFKLDHVLISPAGYFSDALKYNYQPSKRLRDHRAAKLRIERQELEAHQKSIQEQQAKLEEERKSTILRVKKLALTDLDHSELRKEAVQTLISQGAMPGFILPITIESQMNLILLNR